MLAKNKKQFQEYFKANVLPHIKGVYEQSGHMDRPARREEWNNMIDAMVDAGELPKRALDWSCPW